MGTKPKSQDQADKADGKFKPTRGAERDTTYGEKKPVTRQTVDMYLERMCLEARQTLERGGKITFDFKRRQAVLTVVYPDESSFADYEAQGE